MRAEKQPRAEFAADQIGVLALPAEAGGFGQRLFHHRRGVDEHLDVGAAARGELAGDFLQPALDDVVVVAVVRIDRDRAAIRSAENVERIVIRPVVHARARRSSALPATRRCGSPRRGRGLSEPLHRAVQPFGHELREPCGRQRNGIGRGDGDQIEAGLSGLAVDEIPEARRIGDGPGGAHLEIEIRVMRDRRQAAHPVAEQRAEGRPRFQPGVPVLAPMDSRSSRSRRDSRAPTTSPPPRGRHRKGGGRPASCACRPASWCISCAGLMLERAARIAPASGEPPPSVPGISGLSTRSRTRWRVTSPSVFCRYQSTSRRISARSIGIFGEKAAFALQHAARLVEILGNHGGADDRHVAFGEQHGQGAGRIERRGTPCAASTAFPR